MLCHPVFWTQKLSLKPECHCNQCHCKRAVHPASMWLPRKSNHRLTNSLFPVVVVHVLLDGGLAGPEHVHELGPLEEDGALDEVPDGLELFKMVSNGSTNHKLSHS